MNFNSFVEKRQQTGSTYICNPPVQGTDIDTVLLVKGSGWELALSDEQFVRTQSEQEYDSLGTFSSWRRGAENYIITEDEKFYAKFVFATEIARLLNLKQKTDRVKLFQAILYNTWIN